MSHPRSTRSQVAIGLEIAGREEILRVLLKAGVVVVLGTLALLALFEGGRIVLWPYAALLGSHCAAWVLLRSRRLRPAAACGSWVLSPGTRQLQWSTRTRR